MSNYGVNFIGILQGVLELSPIDFSATEASIALVVESAGFEPRLRTRISPIPVIPQRSYLEGRFV